MARQKLAAATRDLAALRVPAELASAIDAFAEEAGSTQADARRELYRRGLGAAANPVLGEPQDIARRRAPRSAAVPTGRPVERAHRTSRADAIAPPSSGSTAAPSSSREVQPMFKQRDLPKK